MIKTKKPISVYSVQFHSEKGSSKIYFTHLRHDMTKLINKILDKLEPDKAVHVSFAKLEFAPEDYKLMQESKNDKVEEIKLNLGED
jgi:hypothetical protein